MPKYTIQVPYLVYVTVEDIEAEDVQEAIREAEFASHISSYAGNGGISKLIGVYGDGLTIEADEVPLYLPEHGIQSESIGD